MLYIEKGGEAQIADELAAYNPLIPKGRELVATVMFEIDDPVRRRSVPGELGGVEETAIHSVGGETVRGVPEEDQERTTRTARPRRCSSSTFPSRPGRSASSASLIPGDARLQPPAYGHMAILPEASRAALAQDFD